MNKKTARNTLLFLMTFLGLGAIAGGLGLIICPSGEMSGMNISMLNNSPFYSFLIPGIVLFSVLGLVPLMMVVALLKKPQSKLAEQFNFFVDMHWSWTYTIYIAFVLIFWLQIQMVILNDVHWLHTVYMFYAVVLIFVALLPQVRNLYKK